MAMSAGRDDADPMMEMNTTPLIDVMLVLLIMFILTIPMQTHAVKVDLPVAGNPPLSEPDPIKNKVAIDRAGKVTWNGAPVSEDTLRRYLDRSATMSPEPELQFQPDPGVRYETVERTMAAIKRSPVTKIGFVGNEQYHKDF